MENKVPLRVKIGLRSSGEADHPNWFSLPSVPPGTGNVEKFLEIEWLYDKTSGHAVDSLGSPIGSQLGVVLMIPTFAREALDTLPARFNATVLTEPQLTNFYRDKVVLHLPTDIVSVDALTGLNAELNLRLDAGLSVVELRERIARALDRTNPENGVRENRRKVWTVYKNDRGILIVAAPP